MFRSSWRLWMIPDLGTDARLLAPQFDYFTNLGVLPSADHTRCDDLSQFAALMVDRWLFGKEVDTQNRFFLGGIGFGGLLALETALQLQSRAMAPAGVLLIGSARSHTSIRSSYRFMQALIGRLPSGIGRWRLARAQNKIASDESMSTIHRRLLQDMAQDFDWSLLRWQVRALASWNRHRSEFESTRIPIYQLHGRGDRFYRIPPVEDATILIHGQHLINLSLSGEVNRWIESILRDNELRNSQRPEI